jgi:hypothetical protein
MEDQTRFTHEALNQGGGKVIGPKEAFNLKVSGKTTTIELGIRLPLFKP